MKFPMTNANLHIGIEKTGTTSIQEFLAKNASNLAEVGYQVPACFKRSNHYELAIIGINNREDNNLLKWARISRFELESYSEGIKERIRDDILAHRTYLISSEFLTSQVDSSNGPNRILSKIAPLFESIKATVFIRRPEQLLISRFSTAILAGRKTNLIGDEIFEEQMAYRLLFKDALLNWEKNLGPRNLIYRAYPERLHETSVIDRYLESIGVQSAGINWTNRNLNANVRLSKKAIYLIMKLNEVGKSIKPKERSQIIAEVLSRTSNLPPVSLSPVDYERVSTRYAAAVAWISKKLDDNDLSEFLNFVPSFEDERSWISIDDDEINQELSNICEYLQIKLLK